MFSVLQLLLLLTLSPACATGSWQDRFDQDRPIHGDSSGYDPQLYDKEYERAKMERQERKKSFEESLKKSSGK